MAYLTVTQLEGHVDCSGLEFDTGPVATHGRYATAELALEKGLEVAGEVLGLNQEKMTRLRDYVAPRMRQYRLVATLSSSTDHREYPEGTSSTVTDVDVEYTRDGALSVVRLKQTYERDDEYGFSGGGYTASFQVVTVTVVDLA